jgi:hypothetical protein
LIASQIIARKVMAINCNPPPFNVKLIVILILLSFACWFIYFAVIRYGPSNLNFHVTEASLTKFNLTRNNTLSYKLEAKIASRNPNKKVTVHYLVITAYATYRGTLVA